MDNLPNYIPVIFALTTLATVVFFYRASRKSGWVLVTILAWLLLQSVIASTGFYTVTNTIPPRFILLVMPALIFIAFLFLTKKGRAFIDSFHIKSLLILHTVRIPVELVLFWLFLHKAVPVIMTFEGRNLDILSGITAPFIYFIGNKSRHTNRIMLWWNICCLILLLNIVTIAILSAPFNFQKFSFDQPDIAILHFPFIWLPCCIVPIVLLSHLVSIRQIILKKKMAGD